MRYYIFLLISVSCLLSESVAAASEQQLAACLEQGKKEFAARSYTRSRNTFERCLSLDDTNVDALLSLGGVALTLEDLPAAQSYFQRTLQYIKRNSPYLSYTYSMLGDIALKQQRNKEALAYYNNSLSHNEANVNSLVGKAVIIEAQGNKKEAAKIYQTALAVEPLNLIARKRLIALEPVYMTDGEVLEALKQRYAVLPDKEKLSKDDRDIFNKIHAVEQRGGVDYLKNKYPRLPAGYVVTLFKGTDFARDVLTLSGYQTFQKQLGQDAIAVFQKVGVPMQQIFDLRDMKGQKIFTQDTTLTDSGVFVYQEALQGRKAYLLPNEALPPSQEFLDKVSLRVKELNQNGFAEISAYEFSLVKKQTNCSEDTLRRYMGLYVLPVSQTEKRYFVPAGNVDDPRKGAPWFYVASYRATRDPTVKVPRNSLAEMYAQWNYKLCSSADGELLE